MSTRMFLQERYEHSSFVLHVNVFWWRRVRWQIVVKRSVSLKSVLFCEVVPFINERECCWLLAFTRIFVSTYIATGSDDKAMWNTSLEWDAWISNNMFVEQADMIDPRVNLPHDRLAFDELTRPTQSNGICSISTDDSFVPSWCSYYSAEFGVIRGYQPWYLIRCWWTTERVLFSALTPSIHLSTALVLIR